MDFSSRVETIQQIMEVSTKPIILDGDTGGLVEHLVFHVRTLERLGVSAIIIEDKVGMKKIPSSAPMCPAAGHHRGFCRKISAVSRRR